MKNEIISAYLAKVSVIVCMMIFLIWYFEIVFDINRSYLSPFLIGGLLILIVTLCRLVMYEEFVGTPMIYVNDEKEKRFLNRRTRMKHIPFLILIMLYLTCVDNIVVPLITHIKMFDHLVSSIGFMIAIIVMMFVSDKRIKISDTPTVPAMEKINTQDRMLNMIPNYNFSDEYERTRIIKAYSSNAIWQLIALLFVSVIDLVVEHIMGHVPISSYVAIAVVVIAALCITYRIKKLKS